MSSVLVLVFDLAWGAIASGGLSGTRAVGQSLFAIANLELTEAELEAESQRLFDNHIAGYNRATDESPTNNTAAFGESIVKSKGKKREVEGTGKDTTSANSPDGVQQLQGEHRDSVVETKQNFGEAAPSIAPPTACEGEPTDLDRTKSHESTAGSDSSSSSGSSTQTAFRVGINSPPLTAIKEEDAPPS